MKKLVLVDDRRGAGFIGFEGASKVPTRYTAREYETHQLIRSMSGEQWLPVGAKEWKVTLNHGGALRMPVGESEGKKLYLVLDTEERLELLWKHASFQEGITDVVVNGGLLPPDTL